MNTNGTIAAGHRFAAAVQFAHRAHAGQQRKGSSTPYIAHPMSVAALAMHYGASEDVAIAALLHDTVEDCGGAPIAWRIRWMFGARVREIVDACTDSHTTPKAPWESRKRDYVAKLPWQSREVKLVVACDKLDNLRATADDLRRDGDAALGKFSAPPARLRWYYEECVRRVEDAIPTGLAARLDAELRTLQAWVPG